MEGVGKKKSGKIQNFVDKTLHYGVIFAMKFSLHYSSTLQYNIYKCYHTYRGTFDIMQQYFGGPADSAEYINFESSMGSYNR